MHKPNTKKEVVIEEIHGHKISDPYRWLEDGKNQEVVEWTKKQNEYTNSVIRNETFNLFSKELTQSFKVVNFSSPLKKGDVYFYEERQPDEDQFVLYMKKSLDGEPEVLVNPNVLKKNGTVTVSEWCPSKDGTHIAYSLSEGGDEMSTLYIKDTKTKQDLPDTIPHCRYPSIVWTEDGSGFFYTRHQKPGAVPSGEELLHQKVYFHTLGENVDVDPLIFGEGRPKDDLIGLGKSVDGRYVVISVMRSWSKEDIYIYDTKTKHTTPLVVDIEAHFSLRFLRDKVLMVTNYKANNYRILWAPLENFLKPIDQWEEFLPEKATLLESVAVTKSKILVEYFANVSSQVIILDYSGKEVGAIPLPEHTTLIGIMAQREEEEFFYSITSFTFPKISYRFNPDAQEYELFKKTDNPINPAEYETKQEWYVSKDGTRVPMFIFHRKGIERNGKNPTILYGYGGFGSSMSPDFMRTVVPWLERDGVYAIANIRGGGEFGDDWHKAGTKERKQNSFDDFIAAAEFLISEKYTNSEQLGILGASNGGLLVAAAMTQRPDLFGAVCSRVPLTDMVRFPRFSIAARWVHEYGDPAKKEDLEQILKWSPYHNVQAQVKYPPSLFMTAEKDTRVDPLHARKMVALLQNVGINDDDKNESSNETLLFVETDAGHGSGKPIYKFVEDNARVWSFFAKHLGLRK